jgi:tRNA(Ile)-lysidine synthase
MKLLFPPFKDNIERHGLIRPGDTVVLGFSGGKDSVATAVLLQELQKSLPFRLVAAYFNHRLRPDAAAEEEWARAFCAGRGIELETGGRDVRRFRAESRLNLEHAASLSRYDFFHALARRLAPAGSGPVRIATAHSRSDLAETFFIKLFRGSGLQGLSAIYASKEKLIVRPLLIFSSEEILAFLERNAIAFYRDPTNLEHDFLRNRIRHELLPAARAIEPGVEDRVFRTVLLLQDEFDHFQEETRRILERELRLGSVLPARAFAGLHPAVARHLAREYLRRLKGDLLGIGLEHVAAFLESVETGRGLSLPGVSLGFAKGWIYPDSLQIGTYGLEVAGTGRRAIPEIGARLTVSRSNRFRPPRDNFSIVVAERKLRFPLRLRPPRPGDRYRKIHSPYRQAVIEMVRAAGVPAPLRPLRPLLENGDGRLVWVCGSPLAASFAVQHKDKGPFVRISIKI